MLNCTSCINEFGQDKHRQQAYYSDGCSAVVHVVWSALDSEDHVASPILRAPMRNAGKSSGLHSYNLQLYCSIWSNLLKR